MNKILFILDLDGTMLNGTDDLIYWLRPHAREFIKALQDHPMFIVAVWTAATEDYAKKACEKLFKNLLPPQFIYSRKKCTERWVRDGLGYYNPIICTRLKKLRKLKKKHPLDRILILDDTPSTYAQNYGNAIPIPAWYGVKSDKTLYKLQKYIIDTFGEYHDSVRFVDKTDWLD